MIQRAGQRPVAAPLCRAFYAPSELSCVTGTTSNCCGTQAIIFYNNKQQARLSVSSIPDGDVSLGEQTQTRVREPSHGGSQPGVHHACWDAYSGSMYASMGPAVVRLSEEGDATVVAGQLTERRQGDGAGLLARFHFCTCITSDGEGCLYVRDSGRLRRLQLPAAWRAVSSTAGAAAAATAGGAAPRGSSEQEQQQQQQQQGRRQREQRGTGAGRAAEQVQVTTIELMDSIHVEEVAYDPASRSLVLCTSTAVYHLPVEGLGAAAPGTVHQPVLVAGIEDEDEDELRDGVGAEARFSSIAGVAVDGTGTAWVLDDYDDGLPDGEQRGDKDCGEGTRLRRVDPSGLVETVPAGPLRWHKHRYDRIAVLRNGYLALVSADTCRVLLLHTGCAGPAPTPSASPAHRQGPPTPPCPRSPPSPLLPRCPSCIIHTPRPRARFLPCTGPPASQHVQAAPGVRSCFGELT